MKVILKKRIPNLGYEWDIVEVKNGYARNYLLPQKLADIATPALIKKAEVRLQDRLKKTEEVKANAAETVKKLGKVTLEFKMKAKKDKLYGSITEKDIVDSLKKNEKVEIEKEMVRMEHIKTIGDHKVILHLAEGVETKITVKVEAE